jgi:hypothetical protein
MKFPLKTGIGTDGESLLARGTARALRTSNLRLLNSEDFLSASQFDPRRLAYQKLQACACVTSKIQK